MGEKITIKPEDVFTDAEGAFRLLGQAYNALALAKIRFAEAERVSEQVRQARSGTMASHEEARQRGENVLEPARAELQKARADYELRFAVYQEAARARDAKAAHDVAKASVGAAAAANRTAWWMVVIAIVQAAVGLGLLVEGCSKIGPH